MIGHNVIIEDNVEIGDNTYIDSNTIIRSGTVLGNNCFIGSNCVIGEYWMDFCIDRQKHEHILSVGDNALIRSGSIIYAGSTIEADFQTGHQVTIRERSKIGSHVSIGTLSDIQGNCEIGNYMRMHSNGYVHFFDYGLKLWLVVTRDDVTELYLMILNNNSIVNNL